MQKSQGNQPKRRDRDPDKERLVAAVKGLSAARGVLAGLKALNVFKTVMSFNDPLNALAVLFDDPSAGATILRKAFSATASEEALIPTLLTFFEFLGQSKFSAGTAKLSRDACYRVAYSTPGLLSALTSALPCRNPDEKQTLAWFLVALCLSNSDARTNGYVIKLAGELCGTQGIAIRAMTTLIFPHDKLDVSALKNIDHLQALDPQHDNDFPLDFREIQIIPTAGEINSDPLPGSAFAPRAGPPDEAAILDRQFRLLREDMVAPILDEVKALKAESGAVASQRRRIFPNPVLVDVSVDQNCAYVLLLVPIPPHLKQRLSPMTRKERVEFCTEGPGRRVLARDSLLLFLSADYSVRCTGKVVRRDKKEFLRHDAHFCVGVEFSGADLPGVLSSVRFNKLTEWTSSPAASEHTTSESGAREDSAKSGGKSDRSHESGSKGDLMAAKPAAGCTHSPNLLNCEDAFTAFVFQTNCSVFAYEPVLRSLQGMASIPFNEEIVLQHPSLPLSVPVPLGDRAAAALADDPNQREAVLSALRQRVCLIQGPPGTGKTYVGVQIVRALLDQLSSSHFELDGEEKEVRILCLCYTNHAVDDFLLSLHEEGGVPLEDMVRLGRSPKIHEKLKSRILSEHGDPFNRLQARQFAMTRNTMQKLECDINLTKTRISSLGGDWTWKTASNFLAEESQHDAELEHIFQQLQLLSVGAFKATTLEDLWKQWVSGKSVRGVGVGADSIWTLSQEERQALVRSWQQKQAQSVFSGLARDMSDFAVEIEELQLLRAEARVPAAARARVLGCTTTSAAKNREILAQLRPNVVIVEEACEILEASLLTCLGPSVKHLIMIGDHKQLRPKLECYRLRKESGQGVNFDVSLFERLAVSGFPMITLNEQRRMRPEICDLIRLTTYPELKDHHSVRDREPARGITSNVIFIDHNHPEGTDAENAVLDTSSKVNKHEAGMVREIVRYFLRQGYQASDLVVLTPYLGQLILTKEELKRINIYVDVNELDRQELQNSGLDTNGAAKNEKEEAESEGAPAARGLGVRVATVDNFQGEEAKIIIGSLVRCNEHGQIGFVAGAERINVLLSRARDAFILLGSADTLCSARRSREGTADWPSIIDLLKRRGQIFPGFPAVCTQHGQCPSKPIDSPEKFEVHAPCGGCSRVCGLPLLSCPHGHSCASFCHPIADPVTGNDAHRTMQCRVVVQELCKNGHEVQRKCGDRSPLRCLVPICAKCPAGIHCIEHPCHAAAPSDCLPCTALISRKAQEAGRLAEEAVKQSAALAREQEDILVASTEAQRAELEGLHLTELCQLQSKKRLLEHDVSDTKKPRAELRTAAAPPTAHSSTAVCAKAAAEPSKTASPAKAVHSDSASGDSRELQEAKKPRRAEQQVATAPSSTGKASTSVHSTPVSGHNKATPAMKVLDNFEPAPFAPTAKSARMARNLNAKASCTPAEVVTQKVAGQSEPSVPTTNKNPSASTSRGTSTVRKAPSVTPGPATESSTALSKKGSFSPLKFVLRTVFNLLCSWWINTEAAPAPTAPSTVTVTPQCSLQSHRRVPPAPKSAATTKTTKAVAEARLSEVLKLADAEAWVKLLSLPELTSVPAGAPHSERFSHIAVQAICLLAEEHGLSVGTGSKKIDPLVDQFNKLNDSCETGCVDNVLVYLVSAVLQYVRFTLFGQKADLQQSAKRNALAFARLLQGNAHQELFQQIPKAWKAAATNFKPAAMPAQSAKKIDPDCAEERWKFCKNKFLGSPEAKSTGADGTASPRTTPSESIDIMLKMTGMESVKRSIVGMYERLQIAKLQSGAEVGTTFNLRCDGNPGTGKTTVARLFASFLVEVGILPDRADIHETSGSKLISDGVKGLAKILEDMKENGGGGVVFVDETYQLNPMPGSPGGQVLDFIMPLAEKMDGPYGKIVWIFSGYTNKMDKLFEHNPGLPTRFPHKLVFGDYTDAELLSIMNVLMQHGGKDVGAAPKKAPAAATPPPKAKKISVPIPAGTANGGYNQHRQPQANGGYNQYGQLVSKPDQKDQWGNTWSYSASQYLWEDDFNNMSGTGATSLGTTTNPLISRSDNTAWLYDNYNKRWYRQQDFTKTQTWYPGSPAPPPPPAPIVPMKPFTANPKWVRVAIARLGRSRGKVGFGNARAVRILFDQTHTRQTMRLSALERQNMNAFNAANKMEFLRDDLLGPKADAESLKCSCPAWKKLQSMTGLMEVKESLEKLVELAVINSDLEDDEQPVRGVVLNRIFLGNPGTGKTTVAALYGQILCHLGLLSKGELVLKNSSDFVGSALGGSESQTRGILAVSEGCVLVIDEAYSLNPSPNNKNGGGMSGMDPFKTAVVDTIVEQVQGRPGEDRAVVMLGYRREMEDFLAKANPGLARRFQMENAFEFKDYDDDQLVKILLQTCADEKISISVRLACYAVKQLARARSLPNFGNAGALNNLLSTAKLNMGSRRELIESDFHVGGVVPERVEESTIFDDLVGCDNVLAELKSMQSSIKFAQKRGKDIKNTFESSFLFVGAPGTGKTTVARKMGVMFHSLGLLPTSDVMEIKAADLATGFVGQASHKAAEVIGRAKGKVLFIDEAYQLNPAKGGPYMQEVVDGLVQALTSEELQGQLVVILAGYEKEIDDMLRATNPGLRSRFSKKIVFENFAPSDVESILRSDLAAEKLALTMEADEALGSIAEDLCKIHEFSNGRDAKTLVKRIIKCYAERIADEEDEPDLELGDLQLALESLQKSRLRDAKAASSGPAAAPLPAQPPQFQFQNQFAPPPPPHVVEMLKEMDVEEELEEEEGEAMEEVQETDDGFSPGSTAFLRTLQDLLDQQGLNSQAGVRRLAHMSLSDPYMTQLARQIAEVTGTDVSGAQELLREWQQKQEGVEEKEAEMEAEKAKARQEKRKALMPIWRCAVCGQANMPYIACYVSPYICEYREVDVM